MRTFVAYITELSDSSGLRDCLYQRKSVTVEKIFPKMRAKNNPKYLKYNRWTSFPPKRNRRQKMKNDLIEQEKMQNVIDNVEKIIKTNGFMAVKENKVLEELYTKVKNSDLKELISKKEKIKDCFFRGRLFNEGEKEKKIKEEGNEDNEFLSFVQPPLIKK